MEPVLILKTSTALLALGTLGGLLIAGMRFAGRPRPPASVAMLHGLPAGAALTLLIFAAATVGLLPLAIGALMRCAFRVGWPSQSPATLRRIE